MTRRIGLLALVALLGGAYALYSLRRPPLVETHRELALQRLTQQSDRLGLRY